MPRPMTPIETRVLMENFKSYLSEDDTSAETSAVNNIFANLGNQIGKDISSTTQTQQQQGQAQQGQQTQQVNEAGFLFAIGLAAALPELSKLVGKTINYFYYQILKAFKASGTDARSTKLGDWLINSGKNLHHAYIQMIVKAIRPFMKNTDAQQLEKIAGVIYYVIIAALGIASGIGATQALSHASTGTAAAETTLTAVKSSEVLSFIRKADFAQAFAMAVKLIK